MEIIEMTMTADETRGAGEAKAANGAGFVMRMRVYSR